MRPTRYCAICGEYVADDERYNQFTRRWEPILIHINGDGIRIYRAHQAVEET